MGKKSNIAYSIGIALFIIMGASMFVLMSMKPNTELRSRAFQDLYPKVTPTLTKREDCQKNVAIEIRPECAQYIKNCKNAVMAKIPTAEGCEVFLKVHPVTAKDRYCYVAPKAPGCK